MYVDYVVENYTSENVPFLGCADQTLFDKLMTVYSYIAIIFSAPQT